MFRINGNRMNMDLTVLGYIRMGKTLCKACSVAEMPKLTTEIRQHKADRLVGTEANGQVCEHCGQPLVPAVLPQVAVRVALPLAV